MTENLKANDVFFYYHGRRNLKTDKVSGYSNCLRLIDWESIREWELFVVVLDGIGSCAFPLKIVTRRKDQDSDQKIIII